MVSISTLRKKCVPLAGMKHFIKSSFPLARKTASAGMLEIKKIEENRLTPNFKNSVHQQRKAPHRSIKFAVNQKFVPLARTKHFLKNAISLDRRATSIRISA